MQPSTVRVVKPDGRAFADVTAGVHSNVIFFNDETLPLEVGDIVERDLPNGLVDQFEITDPGFHPAGHFPAHFQAKHRRVQQPKSQSSPTTMQVTYNLHGNQSRVNIQSSDNSVNINASTESVFDDLRTFIKEHLDEKQRPPVLAAVDEMEREKASGRFRDAYLKFVSVAADHLGLLSPFLPVLTELLHR